MIRNTKILTVFCLTFSMTILLSTLFLPLVAYGALPIVTKCSDAGANLNCKQAIKVGDHVQVKKFQSAKSGTCHGDVTSIEPNGLATITIDQNDPNNINCKLLLATGILNVVKEFQETTAVIENGCIVPQIIGESALGDVLDFAFTDQNFISQENILDWPEEILGGGVFETAVLDVQIQIKNTGVEIDEVAFDVTRFDIIDAPIVTLEGDTGLLHLSWLSGNGFLGPDGINVDGTMRVSSENFGDLFDMNVMFDASGCVADNDLDFGFWGFFIDSITFDLEMEVTQIDGDDGGLLEGILAIGDSIHGTYTFDPDALDLDPTSEFGFYDVNAFSLHLGSVVYENVPPILPECDAIFVLNDFFGFDQYGAGACNLEQQSGPPVAEFGLFFFGLDDFDQTVFDDDSLPLSPPELSEFEDNFGQLILSDVDLVGDGSVTLPLQLRSQLETQQTFIQINGIITSLELQPTPPLPQPPIVGGEFLLTDSTALLLAGAQSFSWMIPVILSGIGIGLFVVSRKSE